MAKLGGFDVIINENPQPAIFVKQAPIPPAPLPKSGGATNTSSSGPTVYQERVEKKIRPTKKVRFVDQTDYAPFNDMNAKQSILSYLWENLVVLFLIIMFFVSALLSYLNLNIIILLVYVAMVATYYLLFKPFILGGDKSKK